MSRITRAAPHLEAEAIKRRVREDPGVSASKSEMCTVRSFRSKLDRLLLVCDENTRFLVNNSA